MLKINVYIKGEEISKLDKIKNMTPVWINSKQQKSTYQGSLKIDGYEEEIELFFFMDDTYLPYHNLLSELQMFIDKRTNRNEG